MMGRADRKLRIEERTFNRMSWKLWIRVQFDSGREFGVGGESMGLLIDYCPYMMMWDFSTGRTRHHPSLARGIIESNEHRHWRWLEIVF